MKILDIRFGASVQLFGREATSIRLTSAEHERTTCKIVPGGVIFQRDDPKRGRLGTFVGNPNIRSMNFEGDYGLESMDKPANTRGISTPEQPTNSNDEGPELPKTKRGPRRKKA